MANQFRQNQASQANATQLLDEMKQEVAALRKVNSNSEMAMKDIDNLVLDLR